MTNWHNPTVEAAEGLALVKIVHVIAGFYIWEFIVNLDYEYSIITGNRKINWSARFYLLCRWSTLLGIIIQLLNLDTSPGINCEAWVILIYLFFHLAFASASCLIVLRIYALWDNKKVIVVTTFVILIADTIALVYVIAITRAHRHGTICLNDHVENAKITFISAYVTDLVLLSLMLSGVLRWKFMHLTGNIWSLMYTQGLIYVVVAALAYTPSVVFLLLNLNDVMDEIFLLPSLAIMSVGASRMYRGLIDSPVINEPLQLLVGATKQSNIRFARSGCGQEDTGNTGNTTLYSSSSAKPEQNCV